MVRTALGVDIHQPGSAIASRTVRETVDILRSSDSSRLGDRPRHPHKPAALLRPTTVASRTRLRPQEPRLSSPARQRPACRPATTQAGLRAIALPPIPPLAQRATPDRPIPEHALRHAPYRPVPRGAARSVDARRLSPPGAAPRRSPPTGGTRLSREGRQWSEAWWLWTASRSGVERSHSHATYGRPPTGQGGSTGAACSQAEAGCQPSPERDRPRIVAADQR